MMIVYKAQVELIVEKFERNARATQDGHFINLLFHLAHCWLLIWQGTNCIMHILN